MSLQIGLLSAIICAVSVICAGRVVEDNNLLTNRASMDTRIINGEQAEKAVFPYIVAINNTFGEQYCAGSIISSRYILTAAHCLDYPIQYIKVITGTINPRYPDAVYSVEEKIVHCLHNKPWMHNDIGLLRLKEDIVFNSVTQPIKMAKETFLENGDVLQLSGWGATKKYGRSSPVLNTVEVNFMDYQKCRNGVKNRAWLSEKNICTDTKSRKGSCDKDSGGPLAFGNDILVGVVNWGEACAVGRPDVFASVAHYNEWIQNAMAGSDGC